MNLKFIPLLLFFSTLGYMANAQKKLNIWDEIEYGISFKKNLDTAQQQVQQLLYNKQMQTHPVSVGRLYYYQLLIDDKRSEDSSFFKKSAFIDSILSTNAVPELNAIMHMLQAKRLATFLAKYYYSGNKNLFRNPGGPAYNNMSREQLDSTIQSHFDASLSMASAFNKVDAEALLWLAYDPLLFLFKPSFSDIAFAQKLAYMEQQKNNRNYNGAKTDWLLLSADELMNKASTLAGLTNDERDIIDTYMQWAMQHKTTNANAYYFIETLARKFLYNNHQSDSVSEKRYEAYLEKISQSPYTAVRANGVYQLCLLWNKMAGTYNPAINQYDYNYRWNPKPKFDTAIQFHYVKALKLYEQNAAMLDSFSYIKNILLIMKEQMVQPKLGIEVYKNQLPGEPIPAMLKYRNAQRVYIRIIKVKHEFTSWADKYKDKFVEVLLQQPVYTSKIFELPFIRDYQNHNCFVKFEGLEAGRYFIIYSDTGINNTNSNIDFIELQVTNISVINNDEKVFVLNRKTGFPIVGALVMAQQSVLKKMADTSYYVLKESAPEKVGSNGYLTVKNSTASLKIFYEKDTITTGYDEAENDVPEEVYDKEEYDNLEEYYEEQTRLHLFTDRAIYRPGQTVHFKGIFITRNPKNGEPLVLNWKNLKLPFYKKILYKLLVKFSKQKIELYVNDAFNRTTDTIKVLPNKFGSVAGSFTIAKTAATGEWEFDMDMPDADYIFDIDNQNNGRFKVEEYKRPSFEMSIEKPKNELQLNDSFSVKIKLTSFAGAMLNNVLVKYSIERNGYVPAFDSLTNKMGSKSVREELENDDDDNWGEAYTNDKGELELNVNDSLLKKYAFSNDKTWTANYHIEAEAIDATGESHETSTNINLSNRPVKIEVPIGKMLDRSNLKPVYISTKNDFAGSLKKPVSISIYRLTSNKKITPQTTWTLPDTWLYNKADFAKWFPEIETDAAETTDEKVLVYETKLIAGSDEKLVLTKEILAAGNYKIEVRAKEKGDIIGETSREFSVYDKAAGTLPEASASFHHLPFNSIEKGTPIKWLTGNTVQDVFSIYHLAYFAKAGKGVKAKYEYSIVPEKMGLNEWSFPMPGDANGEVTITHLYIFNNHLYKEKQTVYVPEGDKNNPEIIVENYRSKLTPGAKETFTVSIKTKNENTAAELMTTMYDASLDKIEKHEWRLPYFDKRMYMRDSWERSINDKVSSAAYGYKSSEYSMDDFSGKSVPLWWVNPLSFSYDDERFKNDSAKMPSTLYGYINFGSGDLNGLRATDLSFYLQGKIAGLSISDANGLDEVVVTGYGVSRKRELTASYVTIRGATSLVSYNSMLVVIDGVLYEGDISKIDAATITQGIALKGADATAIYGSRASNGVLLLSTKGPVVLPIIPEEPPLVIRKNFNESAFFFPQVHAGSDGFYHIGFTMPESVTEWKWKMMAHTKNAKFTYSEKSIFTQLPLMVQPNMPRFLTQGDKLILKSRISNLDTGQMSGISTCIIEDAETGEDISSIILKTGNSNFSIAAKANGSNAFELNIPAGFLHPLRIKVIVKTTGFSDGEEHVIPVLSRKILVSQPQPFVLNNKADTIIKTPALPADAEPYGMGLYIAPKPQAAMLNSLPYLAFYAYGCAEQTFNKMLAYSVATKLMRTDTAAQKALQNIRPKEETTKEALPDELGEETMPWLQLNHAHELQQQKLGKLLDTLSGNRMIEKYMEQLVALQNSDGGITWFKGGKSDGYISAYILGAFGKLVNDSLPFLLNNNMQRIFGNFIFKLVNYCDQQFVEQTNKRFYFTDELAYLHARSFWQKAYKPSAALQHTTDSTLSELWKRTDNYGLNKQAMLIIASLPMDQQFHNKAMALLNSIKQLAINDDGHGTRWKEISNADDLNTHTEETIVRLAEAFEAAGQSKETVDGIIKWLLQNKQDHYWSTTKSTAAAIGLLNRQKPVTTGIPVNLTAMLNSKPATVTDNMFSGKLAEFSKVQSFPAQTNITGGNGGTATLGGMNFYYFTAQPHVIENTNTVTIAKKIERLNPQTGDWEPVSGTMVLKIADKLRTSININAPKQLNYVFIDDKRAAALEPADASSGYEYANSFSYYKSVRDAGFQFFAEKIPSGISSIIYQTVVAQEGVFSNGTTALTCMYQPGVKAYCGSQILKVE